MLAETRQPTFGPVLYSVPGLSGITLAGGSSSPAVVFTWPRDLFVSGVLLLPLSGSPADLARLSLEVVDEYDEQIVSDATGEGFTVPGLALAGFGLRPFPLQRPVRAGQRWQMTISLEAGANETPTLLFWIENP